jgi:hypothetical protein
LINIYAQPFIYINKTPPPVPTPPWDKGLLAFGYEEEEYDNYLLQIESDEFEKATEGELIKFKTIIKTPRQKSSATLKNLHIKIIVA